MKFEKNIDCTGFHFSFSLTLKFYVLRGFALAKRISPKSVDLKTGFTQNQSESPGTSEHKGIDKIPQARSAGLSQKNWQSEAELL